MMMIIKHETKLHAIPRLPARSFAPVPAVDIGDHFCYNCSAGLAFLQDQNNQKA